jgi:hypothetical protein
MPFRSRQSGQPAQVLGPPEVGLLLAARWKPQSQMSGENKPGRSSVWLFRELLLHMA